MALRNGLSNHLIAPRFNQFYRHNDPIESTWLVVHAPPVLCLGAVRNSFFASPGVPTIGSGWYSPTDGSFGRD